MMFQLVDYQIRVQVLGIVANAFKARLHIGSVRL
jgi:hypothetical protein